jgi:hypothetical protein
MHLYYNTKRFLCLSDTAVPQHQSAEDTPLPLLTGLDDVLDQVLLSKTLSSFSQTSDNMQINLKYIIHYENLINPPFHVRVLSSK